MRKRIAVDMDGVLADVTEHFITYHERDFGERLTRKEMVGRPELDSFPRVREYVFTEGFFRTAPVVPGSQDVLYRLHQAHEVFIVSAATEFPQSLPEKQAWLNEHFPFISWQQMVFCGLKTVIQADVMIDDHFKNLDHFPHTTILFTQPHNLLHDAGRHQRVHSWEEIEQILL